MKESQYGYIYKVTNNINNKIYIGQHKSKKFDESYLGSGKLLKQAFKKYGIENFSINIIEWCNCQEELDYKEIYWISKLNATDAQIGYNISSGGQGVHNYKHTPETKKIISEYSSGRKWIHKDNINKFVSLNDYNKLLQEGWKPGVIRHVNYIPSLQFKQKISKAQNDRKAFTNGIEEVHLKPDQINTYIKNGYIEGTLRNGIIVNKLCINNGIEEKQITSSNVDYFLERKWVIGKLSDFSKDELINIYNRFYKHKRTIIEMRKKKFSEIRKGHEVSKDTRRKLSNAAKLQIHTSERNMKISNALKGRTKGPMSDSAKNILSLKNKGKIFVNNGVNEITISKEDLEKYISKGYQKGHINSKQKISGSIWINNGYINKRISETLLNDFLKLGFTRGRLKNDIKR